MTAHVRTISPHDAVSLKIGTSLLLASPFQSVFLPVRNFGGTDSSLGRDPSHHFFGQVGKSSPHQVISKQLAKHKASMKENNLIGTQKNEDGFDLNAKTIKPADLVDEAAFWAAKLTEKAEAQTGKTETALKTVARQTGVSANTLWMLRYRKPKDMAVSIYMKLKAAFEAAEKRQYERSNHEATIARSLGEANSNVLSRTSQLYVDFYEGQTADKINNGGAGD